MGLRHATDADHVVAVTTLVVRQRRPKAALTMGALWGLGHSLTIISAGAAIIAFKLTIPERTAHMLEFLVGAMLAALGALNLLGFRVGRRHEHRDDHHHHEHLEDLQWAPGGAQAVRALVVGVVHGLAGSAELSLLVLAAIPATAGAAAAMAYLGIFCVGTLVGMAVLSSLFGWAAKSASDSLPISDWLEAGVGIASLAFGLYIMYHFGRALT